MRVFLTAANIIDETIYHLLNHHYKEFRTIFPLPRFESHKKRGEVGNINLMHERNLNDQDRHELATVVIDRGTLYTFAVGTNEERWNKVDGMFTNVIESFNFLI